MNHEDGISIPDIEKSINYFKSLLLVTKSIYTIIQFNTIFIRLHTNFYQMDDKKNNSSTFLYFLLAMANIFMMTIGAGVYALASIAKSLGLIYTVMLTIIISSTSLFSHYAILIPIRDFEEKGTRNESNKNFFIWITGKLFEKQIGFKIWLMLCIWTELFISAIAFYSAMRTYLSLWLGWQDLTIFENKIENMSYWGFFIVFLVVIFSYLTLKFSNNKESFFAKYIETSVKIITIICMNISCFGYIIFLLTKIHLDEETIWNNSWIQIPDKYQNQSMLSQGLMISEFLSISCFCFLNQLTMSDVVIEYEDNTKSKNGFFIAYISQFLFVVIYLLAAIVPVLAIDHEIQGNILLQIDGPLATTLQICSFIGLFFSLTFGIIPYLFHVTLDVQNTIKQSFGRFETEPESEMNDLIDNMNTSREEISNPRFEWKRFLLCILLCLVPYLIGATVGNGFEAFVDLVGCIASSMIMFVLPGFLLLRSINLGLLDHHSIFMRYMIRMFAIFIIVLGCIIFLFGGLSVFKDMILK
jgi:amino acid permease